MHNSIPHISRSIFSTAGCHLLFHFLKFEFLSSRNRRICPHNKKECVKFHWLAISMLAFFVDAKSYFSQLYFVIWKKLIRCYCIWLSCDSLKNNQICIIRTALVMAFRYFIYALIFSSIFNAGKRLCFILPHMNIFIWLQFWMSFYHIKKKTKTIWFQWLKTSAGKIIQ